MSDTQELYGSFTGNNLRQYIHERYGIPDFNISSNEHSVNQRDTRTTSCTLESVLQTVRNKYAMTKSCQDGMGYDVAFKAYSKWLQKCHPGYFTNISPCSGPTVSTCFPWVTFDLASSFLNFLAMERKDRYPVVKLALSALNFILNQQHVIAQHILGFRCPAIQTLRHNTGVSGGAIAASRATFNEYTNASMVTTRKDGLTTQKDPQRGRIESCLSHNMLIDIQKYFLLGECVSSSGEPTSSHFIHSQDYCLRARDRFLFNACHFAAMRGDDLRCPYVSWGHVNTLPFPDIIGPDKGFVYIILKDKSKSNKEGRNELAGWIRHKEPELCCVNSIGEYLILLYGRDGKKSMPSLFHPNCHNWVDYHHLLIASDYRRPMHYSNKRQREEQTEELDDELDNYEGHYEGFKRMKLAVGIRKPLLYFVYMNKLCK